MFWRSKGNQGNMHENIKLYFEDALNIGFKDIEHEYFETIDGDHGRVANKKALDSQSNLLARRQGEVERP